MGRWHTSTRDRLLLLRAVFSFRLALADELYWSENREMTATGRAAFSNFVRASTQAGAAGRQPYMIAVDYSCSSSAPAPAPPGVHHAEHMMQHHRSSSLKRFSGDREDAPTFFVLCHHLFLGWAQQQRF